MSSLDSLHHPSLAGQIQSLGREGTLQILIGAAKVQSFQVYTWLPLTFLVDIGQYFLVLCGFHVNLLHL